MSRRLQPFIMECYLPCIAIVIVSHISFILPLDAIPGRVALLVTQFLTLTNICIHQQVIAFQMKINFYTIILRIAQFKLFEFFIIHHFHCRQKVRQQGNLQL